MAPRPWGWWTQHKLQILDDYLRGFATASSKRATQRIYLDLFAGQTENALRGTDEEILGSVHRALAAEPPFTHVHLFELPSKAVALENHLRTRYPGRDLRVHAGDCNETLAAALHELAPVSWAPTFVFVDQQATEVQWSSLEQIAAFRKGEKTKSEMWILFGTSFLPRGLQLPGGQLNAAFGDRITTMFGSEEWVPIHRGRQLQHLSAKAMRLEFVNLMRWRLEHVLGYTYSHAFTMKNTSGNDLFDMIFVTDHHVGDKIMRHLYNKAIDEHEVMRSHAQAQRQFKRQEEKQQRAGQDGLFAVGLDDVQPAQRQDQSAADRYSPQPPREPYRLP